MKNTLLFILISAIIIVIPLPSCEKIPDPPISSFSINKTTAEINEPVSFTNSSKNAVSYYWNFGDNSSSTEENPVHTYTMEGVYTITLIAEGEFVNNNSSKEIKIIKKVNLKIFKYQDIIFQYLDKNSQ